MHRFDWHLGYEDSVSPPPLQPPQPPLPVRRLHEERGQPEQRGIDLRNRLSQRGQQGGCRVPLAPRLEREEDDDDNFGGGNGRAPAGRSWTDVLFRRGRSREPQGGNDGRYRNRTPPWRQSPLRRPSGGSLPSQAPIQAAFSPPALLPVALAKQGAPCGLGESLSSRVRFPRWRRKRQRQDEQQARLSCLG